MRNLSLCMDFSNMSFRALFTCKYNNSENIDKFDSEEECGIFARKLMNDIAAVVRMFTPNEVFLIMDSKNPWRSDICENYKGTRKRDNINIANVMSTMSEVSKNLESKGFRILKVDRAEADDLAALFIEYTNKNTDNSVILVSSDEDWRQLVSYDNATHRFVCVYNPVVNNKSKNKFYGTKEFMDWYFTFDKMDIFSDSVITKRKILEATQKNERMELEIASPENVLLTKLLCGDDGDNIPTLYEYYGNTGKKVRITPLKMSKIIEGCGNITTVSELVECAKSGTLTEVMKKVTKKDMNDFDAVSRLERQRDYVELKSERFPLSIISAFNHQIEKIKSEGVYVNDSMYRGDRLIAGSKFAKTHNADNGAKFNGIFRGLIDVPIDKLF